MGSNKIRVAINGFGRIGRLTFRRLMEVDNVEVVAINDLAPVGTLAHLLKYDSIHGQLSQDVGYDDSAIRIEGKSFLVYQEKDPAQLPWKELNIEYIIESTGLFRSRETASKHIEAGAKKVIISAPATGDIKTVVLGINESILDENDQIVSNASCTTNCLAPLVKVLDEKFGVEKGYISTIHAYTSDQNIHDAPHKDLRRARAAAMSIIPTTTGAAAAVGKVIPSMNGKLNGIAMRVPVSDGSITDFTAIVKRDTTTDEVNAAFKAAAENELKGILEYTELPLVSIDIIGNSHSSILDSDLTSVNGNLVKVVSWYDNEYGYACRTCDLLAYMAKL